MREAVERAIETMWDRYRDPLSLSEIADVAILSRFHFSRIFRSLTGTSPCRFLTAVRLFKAKNLLLETSMSVTDIAYEVGYNSLGTFTSRFTWSVGVSPARYRRLSRMGMPSPPIAPEPGPGAMGVLCGLACTPDTGQPMRIYIGAFPGPIAQGPPVSCDVLDTPGPYRLTAVPDGEWHVRAVAVAVGEVDPRPSARRPLFLGTPKPVVVRGGACLDVDIDLHPRGIFDLPVLLALPELDCEHLPRPEAVAAHLSAKASVLVVRQRAGYLRQ